METQNFRFKYKLIFSLKDLDFQVRPLQDASKLIQKYAEIF